MNPHLQPAGLSLPLKVGLRGRFRWQVLDERGVPEVPRTESGHTIGPAEGIEQDNLFLDQGLENLFSDGTPSADIFSPSTNSNGNFFRSTLHVGTGSTEPSVSDATLDNEVARAASSGAFSEGYINYQYVSEASVFRATGVVTRLVQMSANRNLTEIGLSNRLTSNVNIRELLRDGEGNPAPVSLLEGKSLRVDHSMIGEISAVGTQISLDVEEYDAANNLVNTVPLTVTYGPFAAGGSSSAVESLWKALHPRNVARSTSASDSKSVCRVTSAGAYNPISASLTQVGSDIANDLSYVPNSFQRTFRTVLPAGAGNSNWHGYMIGCRTQGGLLVNFDAGGPYLKKSTDTLQVGVVIAYGRA